MPYLAASLDTAALLDRAATLHVDLRRLCDESLALIQRARDLTYARRRVIRGGSDAGSDLALITEAIAGAFLCVQCIAKKTGLRPEKANDLLKLVARLVRLTVGVRRCNGCLESKNTFGISITNGQA